MGRRQILLDLFANYIYRCLLNTLFFTAVSEI